MPSPNLNSLVKQAVAPRFDRDALVQTLAWVLYWWKVYYPEESLALEVRRYWRDVEHKHG